MREARKIASLGQRAKKIAVSRSYPEGSQLISLLVCCRICLLVRLFGLLCFASLGLGWFVSAGLLVMCVSLLVCLFVCWFVCLDCWLVGWSFVC